MKLRKFIPAYLFIIMTGGLIGAQLSTPLGFVIPFFWGVAGSLILTNSDWVRR